MHEVGQNDDDDVIVLHEGGNVDAEGGGGEDFDWLEDWFEGLDFDDDVFGNLDNGSSTHDLSLHIELLVKLHLKLHLNLHQTIDLRQQLNLQLDLGPTSSLHPHNRASIPLERHGILYHLRHLRFLLFYLFFFLLLAIVGPSY